MSTHNQNPPPFPLPLNKNERLIRDFAEESSLQSILQKPCFLTSLVLSFIDLLQNKYYYSC